jgi:hypothetical protein
MIIRRRSLTLASAAIVIFSAGLFAQTTPQPRKLTDAEKKEIQTVQKVVDDAAAGQSAPNEVGLTWVHEDLLKAQGNKQYLQIGRAHILLARGFDGGARARGRREREGCQERRQKGRTS